MNRVITRADKASNVISHNLIYGKGLAPMPRQRGQSAYRFRHDRAADRSGTKLLDPSLLSAANDLITEARRTWAGFDSDNAFCEVPATDAGLVALRQLISEGINVRVTMLFSLRRYRQVLDAYIEGMEERLAQGKPVRHVASIANLCASSVDRLAAPVLESFIAQDSEPADLAEQIHGNIGNAINTLAHQINRQTFRSERFQKLAKRGVRGQCLFVSCDDCGPLSLAAEDVDYAQWVLECLPELGIDIDAIAQQLESAGAGEYASKAEANKEDEVFDMSSYFTNGSQRPLGLMA